MWRFFELKFKFIINNKNISIATFKIKLNNNSSINVKAYNEMADWCYQKLVKNDLVTIQGSKYLMINCCKN